MGPNLVDSKQKWPMLVEVAMQFVMSQVDFGRFCPTRFHCVHTQWCTTVAQAQGKAPRTTSTASAPGCKPIHTSRNATAELRSAAVATAFRMQGHRKEWGREAGWSSHLKRPIHAHVRTCRERGP